MKSSNWKHKNFPGTEHLNYSYADVLIGKCFNADHLPSLWAYAWNTGGHSKYSSVLMENGRSWKQTGLTQTERILIKLWTALKIAREAWEGDTF